MRQEFYIQTIPKGQPRARFFVRKGQDHVSSCDPQKSINYKTDIKIQVLNQHPQMMEGPLTLLLDFYMARPKNHYGAKGLKPNAPTYHDKKPDLDNLVKAVKDALKGIVWRDDSQVSVMYATKKYADMAGIRITLQEAN